MRKFICFWVGHRWYYWKGHPLKACHRCKVVTWDDF